MKSELIMMIWKKAFLIGAAFSVMAASGCKASGGDQIAVANSTQAKVDLVDISDHWAKDSILSAVNKGYVDGYEDHSFKPDFNLSRGEFIKMVVTAMKLPVTATTNGGMWYVPYVNAAKTAGIYQSGDFDINEMNQEISRVDMSKLSLRATDKTLQNPVLRMDDVSVMYNAVKKGLIQGLINGELGPEKTTTRAQSVTIIERILRVQAGEKLPTDKYAASNAEIALKKTNIFSMAPSIFGGDQTTKWDPTNLFIASSDGKYKGVIDSLILIDLADPNDPHRSLLGDFNSLRWLANKGPGKDPFVKDYPDSYVLFFNMHNEVNEDTDKYVAKIPRISIHGFSSPDQTALKDGTLNSLAVVYRKTPSDLPAYVIPKSGLQSRSGRFTIDMNVPTRESMPEVKVIFGALFTN
ncbi:MULTISPECIES: S-layer homology domain-containing protein [unclassified Paenibacillus]|uniref:S-layer homology domain-containing protein n=1 Tax=unclassified Paenibacillus TaxID=185978 RepID=UPI0027D805A5|nr:MULTISPECIES: S-layer homology domain-containing protein [unclassified Paenibacillus]